MYSAFIQACKLDEQAWYIFYAFNSSYISWKQNKTHMHCAKNKPNFTVLLVSDIGFFYLIITSPNSAVTFPYCIRLRLLRVPSLEYWQLQYRFPYCRHFVYIMSSELTRAMPLKRIKGCQCFNAVCSRKLVVCFIGWMKCCCL